MSKCFFWGGREWVRGIYNGGTGGREPSTVQVVEGRTPNTFDIVSWIVHMCVTQCGLTGKDSEWWRVHPFILALMPVLEPPSYNQPCALLLVWSLSGTGAAHWTETPAELYCTGLNRTWAELPTALSYICPASLASSLPDQSAVCMVGCTSGDTLHWPIGAGSPLSDPHLSPDWISYNCMFSPWRWP